jgi:hypothetical protein
LARYISDCYCNRQIPLETDSFTDIYGNKQQNGPGGMQKDPKAYLRYSSDAEIVS